MTGAPAGQVWLSGRGDCVEGERDLVRVRVRVRVRGRGRVRVWG